MDNRAAVRVGRVRLKRSVLPAQAGPLDWLHGVWGWAGIANVRAKWREVTGLFVQAMLCCAVCGLVRYGSESLSAVMDQLATQATPSTSSPESSGTIHPQPIPDSTDRPKSRKKLV